MILNNKKIVIKGHHTIEKTSISVAVKVCLLPVRREFPLLSVISPNVRLVTSDMHILLPFSFAPRQACMPNSGPLPGLQ